MPRKNRLFRKCVLYLASLLQSFAMDGDGHHRRHRLAEEAAPGTVRSEVDNTDTFEQRLREAYAPRPKPEWELSRPRSGPASWAAARQRRLEEAASEKADRGTSRALPGEDDDMLALPARNTSRASEDENLRQEATQLSRARRAHEKLYHAGTTRRHPDALIKVCRLCLPSTVFALNCLLACLNCVCPQLCLLAVIN